MAIITAIYSSPFSPPVVAPLPHSPTTVFLRPSFSTRSTGLMHWSGLRPPVWLSTGRWTPLLPLSYPSRPMRCLQSFETYRRLNATPRRGLRSLVARSRPPSLSLCPHPFYLPHRTHHRITTPSPRSLCPVARRTVRIQKWAAVSKRAPTPSSFVDFADFPPLYILVCTSTMRYDCIWMMVVHNRIVERQWA